MANPITLPVERIILRELTDEDFEAVHCYGSDPGGGRFPSWASTSGELSVRGDVRDTILLAVLDHEWRPSAIGSRRDRD